MWEDPIVAEVHGIRKQLAADCNFDLEVFFAGVRKRQALLGDRLVAPKKRAAPTAEADQGHHSGSSESTSSESAPAA
jgi:hypothetical protein